MTAHGLKRGDSVGVGYFKAGQAQGGHDLALQNLSRGQMIGRSYDNFLANKNTQGQQQVSHSHHNSTHSQ